MNRPRYFLIYSIAILCAIFDATLSNQLSLLSVRPEILFVIPVFWALQARSDQVIFHAWTAGLLKDVFSISTFGTYGLLFAFGAFVLSLFRGYLYRDSMLTLFLVAMLFELLINGLYGFSLYALGANMTFWDLLLYGFFTSLYSSVAGVLLLRPMVLFEEWLGFLHY